MNPHKAWDSGDYSRVSRSAFTKSEPEPIWGQRDKLRRRVSSGHGYTPDRCTDKEAATADTTSVATNRSGIIKGRSHGGAKMQTARSMRLALIGIAALAGSAPVGTAIGQGTTQGLAQESGQSPAARLALVIGNAGYTLAPALPACAASANMAAARLKAAGFDVAERLDASNGAMGAALTEFARALALHPGAAAVVYVCGYAMNLRDRDFVLPVSANLARPSDVLTEGVVARAFGTTAGGAQAGPGLVLLDLFALPTTVAAAPTGTLAQETTNGHLAIAVALEPPGPAAATPAATALAQALGETEVKLPGLIGHLQSLMPSAGRPSSASRKRRPTFS